jgi:hypothetical protein
MVVQLLEKETHSKELLQRLISASPSYQDGADEKTNAEFEGASQATGNPWTVERTTEHGRLFGGSLKSQACSRLFGFSPEGDIWGNW